MDLVPVMDALVPLVEALPDAILQLDVHDEIFESESYWHAPALGAKLLEYNRHDRVEVRVHPYFTDNELWEYLSQSRSRCCLTVSAPTPAGWRHVSTLEQQRLYPVVASTANNDHAKSSTSPRSRSTLSLCAALYGRIMTAGPPASRRPGRVGRNAVPNGTHCPGTS